MILSAPTVGILVNDLRGQCVGGLPVRETVINSVSGGVTYAQPNRMRETNNMRIVLTYGLSSEMIL